MLTHFIFEYTIIASPGPEMVKARCSCFVRRDGENFPCHHKWYHYEAILRSSVCIISQPCSEQEAVKRGRRSSQIVLLLWLLDDNFPVDSTQLKASTWRSPTRDAKLLPRKTRMVQGKVFSSLAPHRLSLHLPNVPQRHFNFSPKVF